MMRFQILSPQRHEDTKKNNFAQRGKVAEKAGKRIHSCRDTRATYVA
jgi:hypothetical protein